MKKDIINTLKDEFIPFAGEVIINNLPSIDGCIAVQRKVLWSMYLNKVFPNKPFIKMLRASAYAMIFYVMGDQSLTGAMKNMGNNSVNNVYLEPKGSFGDKRFKDGCGASPRYIEVRLSSYSMELLKGIDKNNVPTKRNYDNTEDEVILLPSVQPNILINASQTIAVGYSSKMPSHNLIEVCDSFSNYIKTNDIDKSIDVLKGADFSIGGKILYNKNTFEQIYKTGSGSFTLTGSYKYDKDENKIVITEVPYESYIEDIESKLRLQYDKGNFKEVLDIHDSSDIKGIALDIYLKKGTNIDNFITKLRKYTPYENKFSCNFTILDLDGKTPILMSLEKIMQTWIQHRHNCINKEIQFDINKINVDLNKLYGLKIILNDLDTAIKIIRESKAEKQAIESLIKYFELNQAQSEYISTIRLMNINKDWMFNKIKNTEELESELVLLKSHLENKEYIDNLIVEQLEYCKKTYGNPRCTEIIYETNETPITNDILIEDYNTVLQLTSSSYLKKIPATSMRGSSNDKLKDGDTIIYQSSSTNKSTILIYTNKGFCYKLYASDIEDSKTSLLGIYLPQELQLEKDETIIGIVNTSDYSGNIVEVFQNGKIAKVTLESFKTEQKRGKLKNAISIESPLVKMLLIQSDIDLVLQSSINKVLITNTSVVEAKASKNTKGNMVMKSKNDSIIQLAEPLDNINIELLDVEYYRGTTGIGSYLKKEHSINIK